MTKQNIYLFSWADENDLQISNVPDLVISLKDPLVQSVFNDAFFTPGLVLVDDHIIFVSQEFVNDVSKPGEGEIVFANANTGTIEKSIMVRQKIRKLLSCGRRFALVLTPYVDSTFKNLLVIDLVSSEVIGGCVVPHSKALAPDLPQIDVCEVEWLNGINDSVVYADCPILAVVSIYDCALNVVKFDF